jgi:hypothetical protein
VRTHRLLFLCALAVAYVFGYGNGQTSAEREAMDRD